MQVQHTVYLLENDYSSYKQSMSPSITLKEKLHGKNISYRTKYSYFYHESYDYYHNPMESQGVDHEKSRVTSPKSSNVWPPCPTVATINLTIVKGRLIHATLLSDRYSWTPENSWIPATFASNKLSTDLLFHQFFFSLSTVQNFSIENIKILRVSYTELYSTQFHSLVLQGYRGWKSSTQQVFSKFKK